MYSTNDALLNDNKINYFDFDLSVKKIMFFRTLLLQGVVFHKFKIFYALFVLGSWSVIGFGEYC